MDDGLIHRLAIVCKDYYTLTTIDNLFIFAGAKTEWCTEPEIPINGSMRVNRCYAWIEGIRKHALGQENVIITKVINDIAQNQYVPQADKNALLEGVKTISYQEVEQQGINLEALLATLARALASDGLAREVAILTSAQAWLEWTETNSISGIDVYNLYLSIPYKLYDQVKDDIKACEREIDQHLWPFLPSIKDGAINKVLIVCQLLEDDRWREKGLAWLIGQNVNNQGRVRSDNVAPRTFDGLQFRSEPEINLYRALKSLGISFAPLPVFVRGGQTYRRIEPDFVIVKEGIVLVVEVDGDTYHKESPAEADNRTMMLDQEGARIIHVQASECETAEKASTFAKTILQRIAKYKEARR